MWVIPSCADEESRGDDEGDSWREVAIAWVALRGVIHLGPRPDSEGGAREWRDIWEARAARAPVKATVVDEGLELERWEVEEEVRGSDGRWRWR